MNKNYSISVILPCYNVAQFIKHNPVNIFIIVILSLGFIIGIAFIYTVYIEIWLNKIINRIVEGLV